MTWFRVDDKFHGHVKPLRAGLAAVGAWTLAGSWCGDHLTDGFVPVVIARRIAGAAVWERLVDADMVEEVEGGYRLHDFCQWNPTRAEVEAERARKAAAGRAGGLAKAAAASAGVAAASPAPTEPPCSRPVPSRPDPSPPDPIVETPPALAAGEPSKGSKAKGTRAKPKVARPADWTPAPSVYALGEKLGFNRERVDTELHKFREHHDAKGSTFADWQAAARLWLRNAASFQRGPGGRSTVQQPARPGDRRWRMNEEIK
jgi:hypothetical protein